MHLLGPKSALITSSAEPRFTTEQWQAGAQTELFCYAQEGEDVEDVASEHRSTSSGSEARRPISRSHHPKRTLEQAYSHSPPPAPTAVLRPRLQPRLLPQHPKPTVQTDPAQRDRELPLSGIIEAQPIDPPASRQQPPQPPPAKRSRVTVGHRQLPEPPAPQPSGRQLPLSPPSVRIVPKGAASIGRTPITKFRCLLYW